jgi:hypothetical protein
MNEIVTVKPDGDIELAKPSKLLDFGGKIDEKV